MRNFWWDGIFAESSETIWLNYFSVFALSLGAGVGLIGLMASLSNLLSALAMWPGAVLAEKTRRYKTIVVLAAGGIGRLAFLGLAAIPWLLTGNAALTALVALAVFRGFLGSLAMPAWHAFAAEFVPESMRGRYFAFRNLAKHAAVLVMAPLAGLAIGQIGGMTGWQTAWLMAFCLGMVSTAFFIRIPVARRAAGEATPPTDVQPRAPPDPSALRDRRLLVFVGTTGIFQLSVMIAGPFFSVYLVRELGGTPFWVGLTAAASPLGALFCQMFLGRINDRWGPRRLLVVSNALIPVLPLMWIAAAEPWHIIFVNLLGGALWAGNQLAAFNFVLEIAPAERRPTYAAMHQAGLFFASFVGPMLGGLMIPALGFPALFLASAVGRWLATALQWRFLQGSAPITAPPVPLAAHRPP